MYKMKKSNSYIANIVVIALVLSTVVIVVMPVSAAAVSVTRDLPDAVYQGEKFNVSLTQSGFLLGAGTVTETLPEGFEYVWGSLRSDKCDYDEATNNLTIDFEGETTMTYVVKAGTAEQIENAVFSGTWRTVDSQLNKINGSVGGDTTLGEKPTPTPTATATPPSGNGGGNGGGDGGGIPPTPPAGTPAYIALDANPVDIPADGSSTSTITAAVWDGEDWVLENQTVNFNTSSGSIIASAVIANGTATAILTAGMEEGAATITAEANLSGDIGIITNTTTVNFATPGATPTPPILTPTPTVTISPTPTETETPSPSPTGGIPGFEVVFAITSLLAVAYLVRKRERKA